MAKNTSMPNFSSLVHPHGLEDGSLVVQAGPGPGHDTARTDVANNPYMPNYNSKMVTASSKAVMTVPASSKAVTTVPASKVILARRRRW